jgi:predicted metal-dependent phosphoesterase TrpH
MRDSLLLCELHAHSTWSDGDLSIAELVDLYGGAGFDVLCITDHSVRLDDPIPRAVDPWVWPAHAAAVGSESERAWSEHGLILIQGLELTDNQDDLDLSAHALAIGIEQHISMEFGFVAALEAARAQGAAVIAAHPYAASDATPLRATRRIWRERELLGDLIHRYELFNRKEVFAWVANEDLPPVASGDFHRQEHLSSWKTLLPCERDRGAVVEHLRSRARVFLTPFAAPQETRLPIAA